MAPAKHGDEDPFFPAVGGHDQYATAKATCGECPVTVECRTYQLETGSKYGMWAGRSAKENITNNIDGIHSIKGER